MRLQLRCWPGLQSPTGAGGSPPQVACSHGWLVTAGSWWEAPVPFQIHYLNVLWGGIWPPPEQTIQENKKETAMLFRIYPQNSHTSTSSILYWSLRIALIQCARAQIPGCENLRSGLPHGVIYFLSLNDGFVPQNSAR